jgi:hypothetical protein
LKVGLTSVAGIAAGHSILKTGALAAEAGQVIIRIPRLTTAGGGITASSKRDLLEAIAPVVTTIVESSGKALTESQRTKLRSDLLSRGQIQLPTALESEHLTISTLKFSRM